MTDTSRSFHTPIRAAVIGASGGVGGALLRRLENDPRVSDLIGFARDPLRIASETALTGQIDILDEGSIEAAASLASSDGPLDLVVVATGILHRDESLRPEKSMRELSAGSMADVLAINTIGPMSFL